MLKWWVDERHGNAEKTFCVCKPEPIDRNAPDEAINGLVLLTESAGLLDESK